MITKGENKYTFKQYARKEISNYLEGLFDNPGKHIPNFDDLTFNQQEQVLRHISLFEDRIKKLIGQPIDEWSRGEDYSSIKARMEKNEQGSANRVIALLCEATH